jgi:hypothetical protein
MLDTNKIKLEVINLLNDTNAWKHKRGEYRELNNTEFINEMKTKYIYLFENSSTLFESCINGGINIQQLEYMLNMIDKLNNGADYHKTSIAIGQQLVDTYITPVINQNNNDTKK